MKGLSITGLILGAIAIVCGATAVTLSSIGLAKAKPREF